MESAFQLPPYESRKIEVMKDPLLGTVDYENVVGFWASHLENIEPQFKERPTLLACEGGDTRSYRGYQIFRHDKLPVVERSINLSPNHPVGGFSFHTLCSLLGEAKFEGGLIKLKDFKVGFKNLVVFFSRRTSDPYELNDFVFNPLRDFAKRAGQPLDLNITLVEGTEGATIYTYRQLIEGKYTREKLANDIRENLV